MMDSNGQISLEYMLIFAVSLILLIAFTLPMADLTVKNTLDVSDTLDVKADLSKIANVIQQVYGEGQGSRHSVNIDSPKSFKMDVNDRGISCSLKLKDNSRKQVNVKADSNLEKNSITIDRGENSIVAEWPQDSENMIIYRN